MKNKELFVPRLKEQLLSEFSTQTKSGIYGFTQIQMAYNSNKIEGSSLSSEQTASIFDTGNFYVNDDYLYQTKDVEEMTGHFRMFNEILRTLDVPINEKIIKDYHYQLKVGVFEDFINGYPVGEFKKWKNRVSNITTESPENVSDKIKGLINNYNNSDKQLKEIVQFHVDYELIHPFQDGNGRTGRAIIFKQCINSNIIPAIITDDMKLDYCYALNKAQKAKEYDDLIELFKVAQEKYFNEAVDYIM